MNHDQAPDAIGDAPVTGAGIGAGRPAAKPVLVAVSGLTKSFGAAPVLKDVTLDIRAGEVLVLLGPNGAGKSTMLNIIGGTLPPTEGRLAIDGQDVDFKQYSGLEARRRGIQRVFQELSTFPNLTVAENLNLIGAAGGQSSGRALVRQAEERMRVFPESRIPVRAEVSALTVAGRQMVEIARAMTARGARLVILDEPTSALSAEEANQLADMVRRKAAEGVAIIYVTHKLEEALNLADRIVVLRDGKLHWDGDGRSVSHDQILELLGAKLEGQRPTASEEKWTSGHADVLTVRDLTTPRLHHVDLRVGSGEIVGLAGLEGAGQRELLQAIYAARGKTSGAITCGGEIAYVSGDRKKEGLLPIWSVEQNVGISALKRVSRFGFVSFGRLRSIAQRWLEDLGLGHRASSPIVSLSGGNQQRALLGRALASEAPLLLLDDPTRGVDVGAKGDIYDILRTAKEKHRSAIFYSTEVAEFKQCDRVYVMARGCISAELSAAEATEERIVEASFARPDQLSGAPVSEVEDAAAPGAGQPFAGEWLRKAFHWRAMPAALLMVSMFVLAFWLRPNAMSTFGVSLLLSASMALAFAVLAQMLFLLGGDIDLGLGFSIGLANVLAGTYLADAPLIAVLGFAGIILGYVCLALIVELLGVSSIVATLGASFIWLGLGLLIRDVPGGSSPAWLKALTSFRLSPLPLPVYVLLIAAVVGVFLTRYWSYSVKLRAMGNNRAIYVSLGYSSLVGRITIYALAGGLAVLTGLLLTSTTGAGNVNVAASFTLSTVAAAVVGGASFAGGIVSATGAVMAVVGMSLITTNLLFLGVSSEYSTAIGGLVLILALSLKSVTRPEEL